ncbi:Peptidase S24/S26A/S26B/S26C [Trinorchestia longiramus]|nr:Peptidase S24/S26A/S26B/S26C [Trinorchestia longiramus]
MVNGSGNMWRKALRAVAALVQVGCLAHCTLEFAADLVVCEGPSMEPTIRGSDILLSEHISVRSRVLPKGSVVIVRAPSDPHSYICKRLVAGPGDRVPVPGVLSFVPKGHVWLEGDNKHNSTDSRMYGPVPFGLVRGRAVMKLWPPSQIGFV